MKTKYGILILWLWPVITMPQAFTPVWESPYNPMTFYVMSATVNGDDLQAGDEIGLFDIDPVSGTEICVGAGVLEEALGGGIYLEMIASMDDGSNPAQANGFTPGNEFIFRLYSQTHGMITDVEHFFPYPGYDEVFTAQGNTIVDLQGFPAILEPFEPVWESPFNPMTFYITGAQIDGVDLMAGDQIGIFDIDPNNGEEICVGAATLSAPVSPEDYLEMIASMDDGSLPDQANGFTPGNAFIFKIISQDILLVDQVTFTFPYSGYDEVFTVQGATIVELSGSTDPMQQQSIPLNQGWTAISGYLLPWQTSMQNLMVQLSDLEIILNADGFYQPGNSASSLNEWEVTSGYFIKNAAAANLVIEGYDPENTIIQLTTGRHLLPVLSAEPVSIEILFSGQINKVDIIREAIGLNVYWPAKNITTLQQLVPGRAYFIRVNDEVTITY